MRRSLSSNEGACWGGESPNVRMGLVTDNPFPRWIAND